MSKTKKLILGVLFALPLVFIHPSWSAITATASNDTSSATVIPGTRYSVIKMNLTSNSDLDNFTTATLQVLQNSGTITGEISSIALYWDFNDNSNFDFGTDTLVTSQASPTIGTPYNPVFAAQNTINWAGSVNDRHAQYFIVIQTNTTI